MKLFPKQIASFMDSICVSVITHVAPVSANVFPNAQFLFPQDAFCHQGKLPTLSFF